ncbi:HlyD family secretion protein [Dyella sp. C11]|uniref:HlyD family efflux transporter periplasmic adaptor subunit n=1 Tax=Dyella sp. C11 TaxID=2126991 RepID=UPI000D65A7EE|nr:HlyD family secretion protein [Dyella sp. C11]
MNTTSIMRFLVTTLLLVVACSLAFGLWRGYMYSPWTRDGRIRAEVVHIAPDVSGIVSEVRVHDNEQVRRGDVLFVIDPERFHATLKRADADIARAQAQIAVSNAQIAQRASERTMRRAQAARRTGLGEEVVSNEAKTDYGAQAEQADAAYVAAQAELKASEAELEAATAARQAAQIDLDRSVVRAPADGSIVNLNLYSGDYAIAGSPRLVLVESHSFWVYGYFEETKLPQVSVGEAVKIELLSGRVAMKGHVESIATGITDRDNPSGDYVLADVNPVFTWIRLAQRVPVRIAIDEIPSGAHIAAGMTCTVFVQPKKPGRAP